LSDPIAAIETFELSSEGKQGIYGAPYGFVVKVTTAGGLTGFGESDTMPSIAAAAVHAPYLNAMMSGLAHVLVGTDATDPSAAWDRMVAATLNFGRDGITRHAMAAIDIALWDIKGKAEKKPVHELIGGKRRDRVRAYASHPLGETLSQTAAHARRLLEAGFTAVKFGWYPLGSDAEGDEAIVQTLRQAIGSDVSLLIDGGMAWDVATAIARCERFQAYDLFWLEEPLIAYDVKGYAKLKRSAKIPIAAGEMAATLAELSSLIEARAVDYLQVDVSRTGLTEAMRIAALAERFGIPCVNHTYSYLFNAAASLHFVAAVHATALFECQATPNAIRDALDHGQLKPRDGWVMVPSRPGLGVEVDEKALESLRVRGAIGASAIHHVAGGRRQPSKNRSKVPDPSFASAAADQSPMSERFLSGKTAWVTGGASGMGRASALRLAKAGANVAIGSLVESQRGIALKDQNVHTPADESLAKTRAAIEALGVGCLAVPLDVCSDTSVGESFLAITERFGKIDILINAAGSSARKLMLDHPDDIWHRIIETNLNGPFRTIRLCFPGMVDRRYGRIVNFASTAANVGYVRHSAYCASKSGLLGLTRCVALEGAAHGVSCNAVNPGWVATDSNYSACQQEIAIAGLDISVAEYRARVAEGLPQKRFLDPDEVAALVLFLCRDEASGINSEAITIAMGSLW
jgi:L-alanine-DL-glutamate epimerase-like enolase superfamily enzyme/short-subunit dehydrogenase